MLKQHRIFPLPLFWLSIVAVAACMIIYNITAVPVTLVSDSGVLEIKTHDPENTCLSASVQLAHTPYDKVTSSEDQEIEGGTIAVIEYARRHRIYADGDSYMLWSSAATTQDLLKELNIILADRDEVIPSLKSSLKDGVPVRVVRVTTAAVTEEDEIPFAVDKRSTRSLLEGTTKVIKEGIPGKVLREYLVTYADGVERSRKLISEEVLEKPVSKVVSVGTMPKTVYTASRGGIGTVVEGMASWYQSGARTASGERFDPNGYTAAFPDWSLMGAVLQVTYLRTGRSVEVRVNDYGPAAWTGKIIDLSRAAAEAIGLKSAGVGKVRIKIIRMP